MITESAVIQQANVPQQNGFLYHGTPLCKLESVLREGLKTEYSLTGDARGKYICLARDLNSAYFFAAMNSGARPVILGAIEIDRNKLPEEISADLCLDSCFSKGLTTRKDISRSLFRRVIITELGFGDKEHVTQLATELERKYGIEVNLVEYSLVSKEFRAKKAKV